MIRNPRAMTAHSGAAVAVHPEVIHTGNPAGGHSALTRLTLRWVCSVASGIGVPLLDWSPAVQHHQKTASCIKLRSQSITAKITIKHDRKPMDRAGRAWWCAGWHMHARYRANPVTAEVRGSHAINARTQDFQAYHNKC